MDFQLEKTENKHIGITKTQIEKTENKNIGITNTQTEKTSTTEEKKKGRTKDCYRCSKCSKFFASIPQVVWHLKHDHNNNENLCKTETDPIKQCVKKTEPNIQESTEQKTESGKIVLPGKPEKEKSERIAEIKSKCIGQQNEIISDDESKPLALLRSGKKKKIRKARVPNLALISGIKESENVTENDVKTFANSKIHQSNQNINFKSAMVEDLKLKISKVQDTKSNFESSRKRPKNESDNSQLNCKQRKTDKNVFAASKNLENHETKNPSDSETSSLINCKKCGKEFLHFVERDQHYQLTHTDVKVVLQDLFSTKDSKMKTKNIEEMDTGIKSEPINSSSNKSPRCGKTFLYKGRLSNYIETVDCKRTQVPTCNRCHATFESWNTLLDHLKLFHVRKEDYVSCSKCSAMFINISNLKRHLKRNICLKRNNSTSSKSPIPTKFLKKNDSAEISEEVISNRKSQQKEREVNTGIQIAIKQMMNVSSTNTILSTFGEIGKDNYSTLNLSDINLKQETKPKPQLTDYELIEHLNFVNHKLTDTDEIADNVADINTNQMINTNQIINTNQMIDTEEMIDIVEMLDTDQIDTAEVIEDTDEMIGVDCDDDSNSIENLMFRHLDDEVDQFDEKDLDDISMELIEDLIDKGIKMKSPEQLSSSLFTNFDENSSTVRSNFDENQISSLNVNIISGLEDSRFNLEQKRMNLEDMDQSNTQNEENWSLEEIHKNLSNLLENIPDFFNSQILEINN